MFKETCKVNNNFWRATVRKNNRLTALMTSKHILLELDQNNCTRRTSVTAVVERYAYWIQWAHLLKKEMCKYRYCENQSHTKMRFAQERGGFYVKRGG